MKFIVESHIPFIMGLFEKAGVEVSYLPPEAITPAEVADADALIVRTRTKCNESLLGGSRCRMVATATIGTDHIDLDFCRNAAIEVANAPGCNAPAVAQYVLASLLSIDNELPARRPTIGVVGAGNVGSIVAQWAESLGFRVLLCDPPRCRREKSDAFVDIDTIAAEADIITFHTPLTKSPAPDATFHLFDDDFARRLKKRPIVVNAARGPVVDSRALTDALRNGRVSHAVIDCWEGEPYIKGPLLEMASIATPHIAGYSKQGKIRATQMAVDAVCRHFGLEPLKATAPAPAAVPPTVTPGELLSTYDPQADTRNLRNSPESFEALRNSYDLRNEPGQN